MNTTDIVKIVKDNNNDYEFYPSTITMLNFIKEAVQYRFKDKYDMDEYQKNEKEVSVLDIGCGDGRAAEIISCGGKKYFIEKSPILRNLLSEEFIPVGTDFYCTNLITLNKVDVIFCNPPYSDYIFWTKKILEESNCSYLYMIIPERWINNNELQNVLKLRKIEYRIIYEGDFLDAERKARAKINIVEFDINSNKRTNNFIDPFKIWYEKTFPNLNELPETKEYNYNIREKIKERINDDLLENNIIDNSKAIISGKDYIHRLVELYELELKNFSKVYIALNELPSDILNSVNISKSQLLINLKEKISILKNVYWNEFFNSYESLKSRLTTENKKTLLNELLFNNCIDFNEENMYAVTVWALKQCNKLYDSQIVEVMESLMTYGNTLFYKSNERTFKKEDWRWNKNKIEKYYLNLELRIILSYKGKIISDNETKYDYINNLHIDSHNFINDIIIVANNLGFFISERSEKRHWIAGKKQSFYLDNGDLFLEAIAYQNENFHLKLNIDFLKALNIEFGRIKKWINHKEDIVNEMNYSIIDANKYYNKNLRLDVESKEVIKLLN